MHPIITIFCPFTRRWAIDDWLKDLAGVEHHPALTNLCIIVDTDEIYIVNMARKFAEARGYRSFHYKMNPEWHPNEVRLSVRRMRVADIHNQSKDLIAQTDGVIIIGLEDDTVFDRLPSFQRLIEPLGTMYGDELVGFVEGVQMGRWGANMIGAWDADTIRDPQYIKTLLPPLQGAGTTGVIDYQEITGGGMYGYATLRSLYLSHDYYTSSAQPWGPDVNYGFYLRQHGYKCLIDWATVFGHNDYGQIKYPDDPKIRLSKITFTRNQANGKWDRTDHEPNRF